MEDAERLLETAKTNIMEQEFTLTSPEEFIVLTIDQEKNGYNLILKIQEKCFS